MSNRKFTLLIGAIALIIAGSFAGYVYANPSQFLRSYATDNCGASIATTTLTHLVPGTSTSTPTFDTQCDGGLSADSATLAIIFNASSTGSTLVINFEYSDDGTNWFSDNQEIVGTSTPNNAGINRTITWNFASSSVSKAGEAASPKRNYDSKIFSVRTPTRYVRAIIGMPGGSLNGAVWTEFIAKKQSR